MERRLHLSEPENPSGTITHPRDSIIKRNRLGRSIVFGSHILGTTAIFTLGAGWLATEIISDSDVIKNVGRATGFGLSLAALYASVEKFFIIRNPPTGMFVTQDALASLRNSPNVNVAYGPGAHFSYPWEIREEHNNISLEEAANEFTFTVQCSDGVLTGKGSYRLRPDQNHPITFLTGVGAVADDISELIVSDIVEQFAEKTVRDALKSLRELNDFLKMFTENHGDVESRFGVQITDVTVSELLPSEDLQKTMSSISEADAIKKGTYMLLGIDTYKNPESVLRGMIQKGQITQADVNLARDRFLSISGNLEGMEIKRSEFDVSLHGFDTEAIKAIAELAKTPAAQAAAASAATKRGGSKAKRKKEALK